MRLQASKPLATLVLVSLGWLTLDADTPYDNTPNSTNPSNTTASPPAPTGLTGLTVPNQYTYLDLNWQPSTGATQYLIERQNIWTGGAWGDLATVTYSPGAQYQYQDTTYLLGAYRYRVSALSPTGGPTSAPSSAIPQPLSYAVIDLGSYIAPIKITDSGKVLVEGWDGTFSIWANGTTTPFTLNTTNPVGYGLSVNELAEDGTAIGWEFTTASSADSFSGYQTQAALWLVPGQATLYNGPPFVADDGTIAGDPSKKGIAVAQDGATDNWWSWEQQPDGSMDGYQNISGTETSLGTVQYDTNGNLNGKQTVPIMVNNQGDLLSSWTTYSSGTTTATGYNINSIPVAAGLTPIAISNETASSVPYIAEMSDNNQNLVVCSGSTTYYLSGHAYSYPATCSINAATTVVNGGTVETPQVFYSYYDNDTLIQCMNPLTQVFDPPQPPYPGTPPGTPGWGVGEFGVEPHGINDYGAICTEMFYTSTGSSDPIPGGEHGVLLLPVQVTLQKQGASAPPTNGVLVKNGDTIQMALDPRFLNGTLSTSSYPLTTSQVNWQYRELNGDGTFTNWTNFQTTPEGPEFNYTTTISGIFQVHAVITVNGESQTWQYVRQQNDPYGADSNGNFNPIYAKGQPDYFGVVDNQWQLDVRNQALAQLGSTTWAAAGSLSPPLYTLGPTFPGLDKCNVFVYQMCNAAGDAPVPLSESASSIFSWAWDGLPPFSIDWYAPPSGTPSTRTPKAIPGWTSLGTPQSPQPGEVISTVSGDTTSGEITHVHAGILDYDGAWINAGSGNVNRFPNIYPSSSNIYNLPPYRERCSTY